MGKRVTKVSCCLSAVRWCSKSTTLSPATQLSTTRPSPCSMAALTVAVVATLCGLIFSRASGSSSANTSHSMQPAAKPIAMGSRPWKWSTKRYATSAMAGCGSECATAQNVAWAKEAPWLSSTEATARPSGMLCTPSAAQMVVPLLHPLSP